MIKTDRLILRNWQDSDMDAFAAINADANVCEFLPSVLSRQDSDKLAEKIIKHFAEHNFGLWAVERIDTGQFIGFTGLSIPSFEADFTPCVEVGWRLAYEHWGNGFATEAATAALNYGFNILRLDEIVSFTTTENTRSRKVMEKIGMRHDLRDDFAHPVLPTDHRLSKHVLYRIRHSDFVL